MVRIKVKPVRIQVYEVSINRVTSNPAGSIFFFKGVFEYFLHIFVPFVLKVILTVLEILRLLTVKRKPQHLNGIHRNG